MRPHRVDTRVEAMRCDAGRKQLWLGSKVTARGETGENCHVLSRVEATVLPCYRALNGNGTLQRWWWGACINPRQALGASEACSNCKMQPLASMMMMSSNLRIPLKPTNDGQDA